MAAISLKLSNLLINSSTEIHIYLESCSTVKYFSIIDSFSKTNLLLILNIVGRLLASIIEILLFSVLTTGTSRFSLIEITYVRFEFSMFIMLKSFLSMNIVLSIYANV